MLLHSYSMQSLSPTDLCTTKYGGTFLTCVLVLRGEHAEQPYPQVGAFSHDNAPNCWTAADYSVYTPIESATFLKIFQLRLKEAYWRPKNGDL